MRQLVCEETGQPVNPGDKVWDFRGDPATLVKFIPPTKPGSTGRVEVRYEGEPTNMYYPSVFGLKWS